MLLCTCYILHILHYYHFFLILFKNQFTVSFQVKILKWSKCHILNFYLEEQGRPILLYTFLLYHLFQTSELLIGHTHIMSGNWGQHFIPIYDELDVHWRRAANTAFQKHRWYGAWESTKNTSCIDTGETNVIPEGEGGTDLEREYRDVQPWRPPFQASSVVHKVPFEQPVIHKGFKQ